MNRAATASRGIRIATPDNWWLLPLDDRGRHQAIAALVDERIEAEPRILPLRNELVARLRRTARDAAAQGALLCASLALAAEDSALSANLLVLVDPIKIDEQGQPTTDTAAIELAMRDTVDSRGEVAVVTLGSVGPAVRVRSRKTVAVNVVDRGVEIASVQYFVTVPGTVDTAVLTFTTPSLAYEEPLVRMFDAMAQTFQFVDGDEVPA